MAILHPAQVTPSKIELVQSWAPRQDWFEGDAAAPLSIVATFRFDDPAGEVGIETLLVRGAGDGVMQIPLTYRGAPLEGGDAWLVGTMHHSVLGPRWVYDAPGDPVYIAETANAALGGGTEVEQFVLTDGVMIPRESTAHARGSGSSAVPAPVPLMAVPLAGSVATGFDGTATLVEAGDLRLAVARVLPVLPVASESPEQTASSAQAGQSADALSSYGQRDADRATLTATWVNQPVPVVLAAVWSAATR